MNPGSASRRSRWRRSRSSAARIRPMCGAARGVSFSTDYQLRIISRDAIGHDVNIPPLPISYRIHSRVGAAATLEGRDLSYVMPMMPIKVLSLVPADAADIRDASEASLGAVDSLRFRSSLFRVLTLAFARARRGDGRARAGAAGAIARRDRRRRAGPHSRSRDRRCARPRICARCRRAPRAKAGPTTRWPRALASMRLIAAAAIDQADQPEAARELMASCPTAGCSCGTGSCARPAPPCRARPPRTTWPRGPIDSDGSSTTRQQQLEGLQSGLSALTAGAVSPGAVARCRPRSTKRFATPSRSRRTSPRSAAGGAARWARR